MLVRGTELWYGVELGMEPFIAPSNFDPKTQELNIYAMFSRYYQANSDAAYGYSFTSAIATLSLGVVANRTYIWGETLGDGTEYVSGQVASATAFTAGTTKRFVIVFDSNTSDNLSISAPTGATWIYIRKGSTLASLSTTYLKYVHFDKLSTLKSINSNCCLNNTSLLGNLYIPDSVTSIATSAFYGCTGLNGALRITENPLYSIIATSTFYNCRFTGELYIPSNIVTIDDNVATNVGAFHGNTGFTSLRLSEGLVSIGKYSFYNCTSMAGALIIPTTVTTIKGAAFSNCAFTGDFIIPPTVTYLIGSAVNGSEIGIFNTSTFNSVAIHPSSNLSYIGVGSFFSTTKLKGDLVIPNSVVFIGAGAFNGCTGLNGTLTLSTNASLTNIPIRGFYNCRFTGTLTIPGNITSISGTGGVPTYAAFGGGNNFNRIVLEYTGTGLTIGQYAFATLLQVTRVDSYRPTAPSVTAPTQSFAFNGAKPLYILSSGTTGYTVAPWTNTAIFSSINETL